MKKVLIFALLALMGTTVAQAQDVLKEIIKTQTAICEDTTQSMEVRKTAVFKVDECQYMRSQVFFGAISKTPSNEEVNAKVKMLNEQALAMHEYINLYQRRLGEAKNAKKRAMVKECFKEATLDNPLFHDADSELIRSYYDRDDYPIQFSLDCDWVRTLKIIRSMDWSKLL